MKKYLSISQVAKILGVSTETLRRWDNDGKFKSSRNPINNYRVYSEEQVENFIREMQLEFDFSPRVKDENQTLNISRNPEITPYFETGYGKLYHYDAAEFLKQLESNSIDLIFADPPYNIKKAKWDHFSNQQEYLDWSMEWIKEAQRVLTPQGSLYICGFSEILADIKYKAMPLFKGVKWLVWYYRNKANLSNDWGRSHESILHFRKSKKFIFNIDQVRIPYNSHTLKYPARSQAETSQYANGKKKKYHWTPHPLGAKPKDVFEIPTISNGAWEKYPHVTQKPVELLRKIILASSNPDSIILDPFGGSGTTYAVAEAYKRRWIGTELEKEYCEMIKTRLSDKAHIARIASEKDSVSSRKRREKLRG